MNRTIQLLIFLFLIGCSTTKHSLVCIEHIDSKTEGDRFIDSLRTSGLDTIIGYYDGCSGCIQVLDKPYYIFYDAGDKWYITKITRYSRFNQIAGYSPPINYLSENINALENMELVKPKFEMSHYSYDVVRILLNNKEIQYEVKDYEKWTNESAQRVIFIDKIRSKLLDILPSEWKGLNYKTEKRKKDSA